MHIQPAGHPILTAEQFIAQGTSAASVMSIARFLASDRNHAPDFITARAVRAVGIEVARLTCVDLGGRRKSANDNGRRANRRAA